MKGTMERKLEEKENGDCCQSDRWIIQIKIFKSSMRFQDALHVPCRPASSAAHLSEYYFNFSLGGAVHFTWPFYYYYYYYYYLIY